MFSDDLEKRCDSRDGEKYEYFANWNLNKLCKPIKVEKMKTVEFAKSLDQEMVVYNEPPHLYLHCIYTLVFEFSIR